MAAFDLVKNSDKTVNGASYIPVLVDGNLYQESTLRTLEYFFGSMPLTIQAITRLQSSTESNMR